MKLAFSTLGCPAWSLQKIAENGKARGFPGVEIRGIEGIMAAEEIPAFFPENRMCTLQQLKDHGLVITDFASSVSFHDPQKREQMEKEGRAAIALCKNMGIPAIRVFGDKIEEADGYQGYYSLEWEKTWHPELEEPEIAFPAYVDWMHNL